MPDPILSTSFDNAPVAPADVANFVSTTIVGGAPFARTLTPFPTNRGSVVFPKADLTAAWVAEGGVIPSSGGPTAADVVAVTKLAGLLSVSNELVSDTEVRLTTMLTSVLIDTFSGELDDSLLHSDGTGPEPVGILDAATPAAAGATLREAIVAAWGEIGDSGGDSRSVVAFVRPSDAATEFARELAAAPAHPDQPTADITIGPGIRIVPTPKLAAGETLVADTTRTFLVVRSDFSVEVSPFPAWATDALSMRVKGRFAVACPTPGKALRTATITP
jgi:Phage capsid family